MADQSQPLRTRLVTFERAEALGSSDRGATKTPGQRNVPLARGDSLHAAGCITPREGYFLAAFSAIAAWAAARRAMGTRNGEQLT